MTRTYTLPHDVARCRPDAPDDQCRSCLRWAEMPGQTFGEWQPVFRVERPSNGSEPCWHRIKPRE